MFPLTVMAKAGAALLVPTLIGQPAGPQCQLDRLTYVSADERAIGRFTAATHDYVAAGRTATLFTDATAEIFRFRLRVTRWLHRYQATDTIADMADATRRHGVLEAPGVAVAALPELPDELRYTLHGTALLLVDRRTNAVVDVLPHAFREGWGRPLALFEEE